MPCSPLVLIRVHTRHVTGTVLFLQQAQFRLADVASGTELQQQQQQQSAQRWSTAWYKGRVWGKTHTSTGTQYTGM
jgi:hypothetical protein